MLACKRCGKENQDHYKFCLGCGAELTAPPKDEGNVAMMKTMMADVGQAAAAAPPRSPTPPGGVDGGARSAPLPGMPAPASGQMRSPGGPPPAAPGAPPPAFGPPPGAPPPSVQRPAQAPPGAPPPGALGGPPPAGPPPGVPSGGGPPPASGQIGGGPSPGTGPLGGAGVAPAGGPRLCPNCQAEIPPAFKFCGACGTPIPDSPPGPSPRSTADFAAQPAKVETTHAVMTLIRPDGSEGGTHTLAEGENIIGRDHGAIFENDGYLSPTHCELIINAAGAVVRDLDSLNGVFVRMTEEEEILPGQIIRIGQELLRFDTIEPPEPLEDGTEVMGSPNPGYWGKITVVIGFEADGSAYPLFGDSVTLGRERGDINFPDDGYVSGLHARLFTRDGNVLLSDLGSSNGTFIKVQGEREVADGSFLLLGQQLFRLEIR